MKKIYVLTGILLSLALSSRSQSLPSGSCGVVYTYDAAGNRTQRKYVCNNGGTQAYVGNKELLDLKQAQQVDRLYPNPTTGHFTVTFSKPLDNAQVVLMDMAGRVMQQSVGRGSQMDFDISRFAPGMYLLRIQDGTTVITQKVVKQ